MISYTKVPVPDGHFKISPSGIATFRRDPKEWIDAMENIASFKGNVPTVKGTCVHYVFESHFDGRTENRYWEDVDIYLEEEVNNGTIFYKDILNIKNSLKDYYPKCNAWLDNIDSKEIIKSEVVVDAVLDLYKSSKNVYHIAGSIDAIVKDKDGNLGLRDYKTTKRKVNSLKSYKPQLMAYVLAYNINEPDPSKQVKFIEVVNIYENTKGIHFNVIEEEINISDINIIKEYLKEIIKTHQLYQKYPKLRPYLFRKGTNFIGGLDLF